MSAKTYQIRARVGTAGPRRARNPLRLRDGAAPVVATDYRPVPSLPVLHAWRESSSTSCCRAAFARYCFVI
jgi:hypothetical protein